MLYFTPIRGLVFVQMSQQNHNLRHFWGVVLTFLFIIERKWFKEALATITWCMVRTQSAGLGRSNGELKWGHRDRLFDIILSRPDFCNDTQTADNPEGNLKKKNKVVILADMKGDE